MPRRPSHLGKTPRVQPVNRPKYDTPLLEWMRAHDVTDEAIAKALGCSALSVACWKNNQSLPELVYARKLELLTDGEVSMVSWFGTPFGKYKYDSTGSVP